MTGSSIIRKFHRWVADDELGCTDRLTLDLDNRDRCLFYDNGCDAGLKLRGRIAADEHNGLALHLD